MLKRIPLNSMKSLRYFFSQTPIKSPLSIKVQQKMDTILSQQQIFQQTQRRRNELISKHTQLQKLIDDKIKLPLKLYGTKDTYQQKYSYLSERIMAYYKIHPTMITDYLMKIYKASLYAMVDNNQEFMKQYMEDGLRSKVIWSIKQAKKQYTLSIIEDKDFMKQIPQNCQIVDAICVRGLSMDRQANQSPQNYHKFEQADDVGLITYTPNHLTYDSQKFSDPTQNKTIYKGYQNLVLRVLLRIRTPLRFNLKQIQISDQLYTWQHLCVMQNQMVSPKHLQSKYKLQTLIQWLGKYRFGPWKMVDVDNFMRGNSLFRKHQNQQEEIDPIFAGTVFDKSTHANIRKF